MEKIQKRVNNIISLLFISIVMFESCTNKEEKIKDELYTQLEFVFYTEDAYNKVSKEIRDDSNYFISIVDSLSSAITSFDKNKCVNYPKLESRYNLYPTKTSFDAFVKASKENKLSYYSYFKNSIPKTLDEFKRTNAFADWVYYKSGLYNDMWFISPVSLFSKRFYISLNKNIQQVLLSPITNPEFSNQNSNYLPVLKLFSYKRDSLDVTLPIRYFSDDFTKNFFIGIDSLKDVSKVEIDLLQEMKKELESKEVIITIHYFN